MKIDMNSCDPIMEEIYTIRLKRPHADCAVADLPVVGHVPRAGRPGVGPYRGRARSPSAPNLDFMSKSRYDIVRQRDAREAKMEGEST